jgi:hypothetical protein
MQWNSTAIGQQSTVSMIQPPRLAQRRRSTAKILTLLLFSFLTPLSVSAADKAREQVVKIVAQIQRADYEGDRAALKRLFAALAPFAEKKQLASRVRYWRGFALWRRAINGSNDHVAAQELEEDLNQALYEFDVSAKLDQDFVEAKIATLSCLGYLAFLHRTEQARLQTYVASLLPLLKDLQATAPDNPRLCWVLGPMYWNRPETGGPAKAIASYKQGLDAIRIRKTVTASDPLNPSWGEPELLMSLAWASLNGPAPDPAAAEQYADSALALVPYWHYLRDVLVPQIQKVREAHN